MIGGFSKSHRDAGLGTARRSRRRRVVVGQRDGVRGAKRVGWADGPRTGLGLGVPGLRMLGRPFDVAILRAALDLAPNQTSSGRRRWSWAAPGWVWAAPGWTAPGWTVPGASCSNSCRRALTWVWVVGGCGV